MTKTLLLAATAALFTTTTAVAQDNSNMKLVSSEHFGDAMTGGHTKTGETKYFYNNAGKIVGMLELDGRGNNLYRTEYNYNEKGHLISESTFQYGLYDNGQEGWSEPETTKYLVDENGNRTAIVKVSVLPWGDTMVYNEFEYEYDTDGNLVSEKYYFSQRGTMPEIQSTTTYSDFAAGKNKPAKKVKTSVWDSECFTATMTYDEAGNKISELEEYKDGSYGKLFTWTYVDGFLTKEARKTWLNDQSYEYGEGNFYTEIETRYEMVNGNKDIVNKSDWSATPYLFNGEVLSTELSMNPGSEYTLKYADFSDSEAMDCTISAEVSDANTNTVTITASIPEFAMIGTVRYDVYRDTQLVGSYLLSDLMEMGQVDPENMTVSIIDPALKNGTYKYFVQIMKDANAEFLFDDPEWVGYNVSNVVEVTAEIQDLPVATNLHLTESTIGVGNGTATVAYDFPAEVAEELGFTGNYLFINTLGVFRQDADSYTTSAGNGELKATLIAGETIQAFIQSRYKYGKVQSEIVTLDLNNISTTITSVEAAAKNGALWFDVTGRQVQNPSNGAYIMISGGKASKVIIK